MSRGRRLRPRVKCRCGEMLAGDDVVVSFVQSDFDAVGAYGGGVRGGGR